MEAERLVVQGETLNFFGTLKASEFHARTGQPPVDLPVVEFGPGSTPASFIRVRVPDTLVSAGSQIVVWHGINGPKRTPISSFKVLKKPWVASFRVTSGPNIEFTSDCKPPTKIEVELADFDTTADTLFRPSLWAPGFARPGTASTGIGPTKEPGGNPFSHSFHIWGFEDTPLLRRDGMLLGPSFLVERKACSKERIGRERPRPGPYPSVWRNTLRSSKRSMRRSSRSSSGSPGPSSGRS